MNTPANNRGGVDRHIEFEFRFFLVEHILQKFRGVCVPMRARVIGVVTTLVARSQQCPTRISKLTLNLKLEEKVLVLQEKKRRKEGTINFLLHKLGGFAQI